MPPKKDYDHLFKLLIIGNSGVGKTKLLYLLQNQTDIIQTVDFGIRTLEVDGQRVKLQVWDTAGQEKFLSIATAYYRAALGVLLVYDVRNRKSFETLPKWLKEVEEHASEYVSLFLVGNYADDPDTKEVSSEEAHDFAEQNGMQLFETSSNDAERVEQIFFAMARKILKLKQENIEEAAAASAAKELATVSDENTAKTKCCT
ncbi:hypothetical protein ACOMHN_045818 [Nucella lapillus]